VTTGSDSGWKQDNDFWTLTDLAPNTRCTFTVQTRNGDGVTTPATSATPVNTLNSRYTLPVDPMVTCDRATGNPVYPSNTVFTFTNQAGWGQGNLKRYDYGWTSDPGPTYNSSSWSSGALAKTATPGVWFLHVRSRNGDGKGDAVMTLGPFCVLDAPVPQVIAAETARYASISWPPVAGAEEYYVECDTTDTFDSPQANSGWITGTSYRFEGLPRDATVYYRAKARDCRGEWGQECRRFTGAWDYTIWSSTYGVALGREYISGTVTVGEYSRPVSSGDHGMALNVFQCTDSRVLTSFGMYMSASNTTQLQFTVYQSDSALGTYTKVASSSKAINSCSGSYQCCDGFTVNLAAGKFYMIGVAWDSPFKFYVMQSSALPIATSFANAVGSWSQSTSELPTQIDCQSFSTDKLYCQQLV